MNGVGSSDCCDSNREGWTLGTVKPECQVECIGAAAYGSFLTVIANVVTLEARNLIVTSL